MLRVGKEIDEEMLGDQESYGRMDFETEQSSKSLPLRR
jgi:hypothetical protein